MNNYFILEYQLNENNNTIKYKIFRKDNKEISYIKPPKEYDYQVGFKLLRQDFETTTKYSDNSYYIKNYFSCYII